MLEISADDDDNDGTQESWAELKSWYVVTSSSTSCCSSPWKNKKKKILPYVILPKFHPLLKFNNRNNEKLSHNQRSEQLHWTLNSSYN